MRPSHLEPLGSQHQQQQQQQQQRSERQASRSQDYALQTQSQQSGRRLRPEDSWIDIASQPSSSLRVSDINESVHPRVQVRQQDARRSRQLNALLDLNNLPPRSNSAAGSSQDEYDESESESDHVLSSSNEDISNTSNAEAEDEDDNLTALGTGQQQSVFTPQPHAFSHPPQSRATTSVSNSAPVQHTDGYFPAQRPPMHTRLPSNRVPTIRRPSVTPRISHSGPTVVSDHDAALRASLTTLLSCANAVRKDKDRELSQSALRRPSLSLQQQQQQQPVTLQLVPESQLNAPRRTTQSRSSSPKVVSKRKSRESSKERQAKKLKNKPTSSEELLLSPTMMSWAISAGVVLIFSAISFSAGYAWGKEIGRFEANNGMDGLSCGREAMRGSRTGLSKLRLSSTMA